MAYDPIYAHEYYLRHKKKKKALPVVASKTVSLKTQKATPLKTTSLSTTSKKKRRPVKGVLSDKQYRNR